MFLNQSFAYNLLFKAASETLLELSASKKFLNAKIGFTSVLHTWGQNLSYHPHLHCVVTGGGLDCTNSHFVTSNKDYFLPVKVLSNVFRGKFKFYFDKAINDSLVSFTLPDNISSTDMYFSNLIRSFYDHDWVVFSKPTFNNPQAVLNYLSTYTHRIAISNYRIISLEDGVVSFSYKDYKDKKKVMSLTAVEFIRRFLMHVLPSGFVKIRHYGLLCNRYREKHLKICRKLIGVSLFLYNLIIKTTISSSYTCPRCRKGYMHFSHVLKSINMRC